MQNLHFKKMSKLRITDVDLLFSELKYLLITNNTHTFNQYLMDIFKELTSMIPKSQTNCIILKESFFKFLNMPIFLCNLIYNNIITNGSYILDQSEPELDYDNFSKFFRNLYFATYETTAKFLFGIYDMDHDGLISLNDIKLVLTILSLQASRNEKEHELIKELHLDIDTNLLKNFPSDLNKDSINLHDYFLLIEIIPDIFIELFSFIWLSLPFSKDYIWFYDYFLPSLKSSQEISKLSIYLIIKYRK